MGFFPSYLEGFPFAVLEMLAASLPVVAYDVPGPRMMLDRDDLVAAGDADAMAGRIAALLRDPLALIEAQREARRRAERFRWEDIASSTASVYAERLAHDRSGGVGRRATRRGSGKGGAVIAEPPVRTSADRGEREAAAGRPGRTRDPRRRRHGTRIR